MNPLAVVLMYGYDVILSYRLFTISISLTRSGNKGNQTRIRTAFLSFYTGRSQSIAYFFTFMMGFTSLRACSPPRPTGIFIKYRKTLDICQGFGDFIGYLKTEAPWESGAGQQTRRHSFPILIFPPVEFFLVEDYGSGSVEQNPVYFA